MMLTLTVWVNEYHERVPEYRRCRFEMTAIAADIEINSVPVAIRDWTTGKPVDFGLLSERIVKMLARHVSSCRDKYRPTVIG